MSHCNVFDVHLQIAKLLMSMMYRIATFHQTSVPYWLTQVVALDMNFHLA